MRQLKITKSVTNRDQASLDKYLQEIGRVELITAEEEVLLTQRIKQGDQKALEKLCEANLKFVVSVAKQYQNQGLSLPDLINEGNLGLIKAAQRFDETRGFKFISYAVWWIRQAILQALAEQARIIRLPLNQIGSISKIGKIYSFLEQKLERPPNEDELAEAFNERVTNIEKQIGSEEVKTIQRISQKHVSLNSPLPGYDDRETFLENFLESTESTKTDEKLIRESLTRELDRVFETLAQENGGEKMVKVLKYYFLGVNDTPMTLEEIGEEIGLTRERTRQIKEKAIKRIRTAFKFKDARERLASYLE